MRLNSPFQNRRALWPIFLGGTVVLILVLPALPLPYRSSEVLISAVGGLWALAFYLHKRHADDAKFMKELLTEFNGRYNQMNDDLQSSLWSKEPFGETAKLKLMDYFNLCAEEWLFWKAGNIYSEVWTAWANGMRYYIKDQRVKDLWEQERQSNSYYGFEFPAG